MIPDEVTQVEIGEEFSEKLENLNCFLQTKMPECVAFHNWMDGELLWQVQLCRYYLVKSVIYTHGVFTSNYLHPNNTRTFIHRIYRMADLVLCATTISVDYYLALGCNAKLVTNPICEFPHLSHIPQEIPTIIWVGRLSVEKNQ